MKNIIFSFSLGFLMLSGVAIADTSKTSATTTSKSTYEWTGVYVGGFVGGATGANRTTKNSTQWTLSHNGVLEASEFSQYKSTNFSTNGSFMGGGTVGYNWQIPKTPYLIGLEGEYGSLGISGSRKDHMDETTIQTGGDYGYGLIGGRLGYAINRSLFYVKGGAVFTQTSTTSPSLKTPTCINCASPTSSSRSTNTGYAIGGGVEYAPTFYDNKNFTVKVEYLYFGINETTSDLNSTDNADSLPEDPWLQVASRHTQLTTGGISTAKIGVNYKF